MPQEPERPGQGNKSSRVLFFVMLAIIVASIAAFLIVRPNPSGAGGTTTNPAAQK